MLAPASTDAHRAWAPDYGSEGWGFESLPAHHLQMRLVIGAHGSESGISPPRLVADNSESICLDPDGCDEPVPQFRKICFCGRHDEAEGAIPVGDQ